MNLTIDWSKPVEFDDGSPCRALCSDAPSTFAEPAGDPHPVVIMTASGNLHRFRLDGSSCFCKGVVRNVRRVARVERWVNLYKTVTADVGCFYEGRAEADRAASVDRFACVKIVVEAKEGDGL